MARGGEGFLRLVSDQETDEISSAESLQRLFPDPYLAPWLRACRRIQGAGYGASVERAFEAGGKACARALGPEAGIELTDVVSAVAIKSGRRAGSSWRTAGSRGSNS